MKKRTLRTKKRTKLIVGEGISESLFLARLKQLYYKRGQDYIVTVDQAGGGDPTSVLRFILHYAGSFDERYMLIDSDRPISQECEKKARNNGIKIIQSVPHCLEGMLLCSLGIKKNVHDTAAAKAAFYPSVCAGETLNESWCERNIDLMMVDKMLNDSSHSYHEYFSKLVKVMRK